MYTTDVRSVSVCTADVHHVTMYTTNVHYIQKMNSMYRVSKKDKTITDCNLYTTVHMRYEAPFNPKTSTFIHKKSSLHWESKLSNVWGQCIRVSTLWRCLKCRQDGNRVKECTCAADKTTTIMHVRCTFVDKLTAIEWNSVPVPGSFVDCCLLHVGSGSNHNPHLTLLLQSPTGLCLTCEHTQDAVMYEMFTCMYGTWIPYICVIYLSVNGFVW